MKDHELLELSFCALLNYPLTEGVAIQELRERLKQNETGWVGLTDDDVSYCVDAIYKGFDIKPKNEIEIEYFERVIKFVEAKLKEKNT